MGVGWHGLKSCPEGGEDWRIWECCRLEAGATDQAWWGTNAVERIVRG